MSKWIATHSSFKFSWNFIYDINLFFNLNISTKCAYEAGLESSVWSKEALKKKKKKKEKKKKKNQWINQ